MKIKPLRREILVKHDEEEQSVILITEKEKSETTGIIIDTGSECILLKPGDRILFPKYAGTPLPGEKNLTVMSELDAIAIIT